MGFVQGLQLLFIGLKLCGVISWAWPAVLAPLIALFALGLVAGVGKAFAAGRQARVAAELLAEMAAKR